jgi:Tfp pilus assembly protein PilF
MISAANPLQLGWQSFDRGDFAHAERIAQQVLEGDANLADGWFLRGLVRHMSGDLAAATEQYERAIALKPDYFAALNNLAVLHAAVGRHQEAVTTLQNYLRVDPLNAVANCNCANSLAALGRCDAAVDHYARALSTQPDYLDALTNFGAMLLAQKRYPESLPYFKRAHHIRPDVQTNNNLGLAYSNLHQGELAEYHYSEALRCDPQNHDVMANLGNHLARHGNAAAAILWQRRALELRPHDAAANDNLGLTLLEAGHHHEALGFLRRALELSPEWAVVHCHLGKAYLELCRFVEAEAHLSAALRLQPTYAHAHNLLGMVQFNRGDDDASLRSFDESLRHDPNLVYAQLNRAFARLRQGDFERGWPDYELRLTTDNGRSVPCAAPLWDGSDLKGRTILVRAEQGRGDIFQCVRYLPMVHAKGGRVVCELQCGMHPFVKRMAGWDVLVGMGEPLPAVDVQVAMMSLPHLLGFGAQHPYLSAEPALVESWANELQSIKGFKIGIAWQGDPKFRFDPLRSIPLAQFESLAKIPGVRLISLQKHDGVDQIAANRERVPLIDLDGQLDAESGPFMDTAAVMMNLDLVITSDTAMAHLAGGLGVPTWIALSYSPDWRWFQDRDDSPWYPTARLFRQTRLGDWNDVFARLAEGVRAELVRRDAVALPVSDAGPVSAFYVPTSPGELLDKFSILQIKSERLTNPEQIRNVRTEIRLLEEHCRRLLAGSETVVDCAEQLRKVNEVLWQIEEDIRLCERAEDFGPRFIELARSVYKNNDHRAALKRQINISLGSLLNEEKTHVLAPQID